jgi:hypothetical protein
MYPRFGEEWQIPGLEATLVWMPAGTFIMGDQEYTWSHPLTDVTLTKGFWIGRNKVGSNDWLRVHGVISTQPPLDPHLPAKGVSWFDAMAFCRALTAYEQAAGRLPDGYVYRLPTEAEWEYAVRRGSTNALPDLFTTGRDWCFDRFGRYRGGAVVNPYGPSQKDTTLPSGLGGRVMRGGSDPWRGHQDPSQTSGFRLVLAPALWPER